MPRTLVQADPAKEIRTASRVAVVVTLALLFDGFDLTVYGAVLPSLLKDPSQIGKLDPATAGALGSYALMGVMVGALASGAIGHRIGRRRLVLTGISWFSLGMLATAFAHSLTAFGLLRFVTGIGLGTILATAGATMAEFAPQGRRNFFNAVVYSGIPAGGVAASLGGIFLLDGAGWRGLFALGASPVLVLLPLALVVLPESPRWLLSRGRTDEAIAVATKHGLPLVEPVPDAASSAPRAGFGALMTRQYAVPTLLLGFMSFAGLLLTYGLNTWLPKIMQGYGYGKTYSLTFLLCLNGGAVIGGLLGAKIADRRGPQGIIATTFVLATITLGLMTFAFPLPALLGCIAVAGVGTIGSQVLIYGFTSNYYSTHALAAGVAWVAGFGRLGGILGPLVLGWMAAAGISGGTTFYVLGAVALVGAAATVFVPHAHRARGDEPVPGTTSVELAGSPAVGS